MNDLARVSLGSERFVDKLARWSEDIANKIPVVTFGPGSILEHYEAGLVVVEAGALAAELPVGATFITEDAKTAIVRLHAALERLNAAIRKNKEVRRG